MPVRPRLLARLAAATLVVLALTSVTMTVHEDSAAAAANSRRLLWSDEFAGPRGAAPDANWQQLTGGAWGSHELQAYTDRTANARLSGNGNLQIVARRETYTGGDGITNDYTSARLMGYHSFQYGYLVARMKIPTGKGLWPAFWTLGADIRDGVQWPATGEIDVMEAINSMSFVSGSLHGPDDTDPNAPRAYSLSNSVDPPAGWTNDWHTYGIYWTESSISWYLDGQVIATVNRADVNPAYGWAFDKPHVPILNLAVGGDWPGAPDATTPFPAVMSVSYVRLYDHP